ncbi:unnamed protein product [Ectocarpus sp. 12 AP-2014]
MGGAPEDLSSTAAGSSSVGHQGGGGGNKSSCSGGGGDGPGVTTSTTTTLLDDPDLQGQDRPRCWQDRQVPVPVPAGTAPINVGAEPRGPTAQRSRLL